MASEGADPNHWNEATLSGDSSSCGTQGSTDSSLKAGPEAGPVGDDPLIARHLCLDALQHLSHQGSNVGLACNSMSLCGQTVGAVIQQPARVTANSMLQCDNGA